MQRKGTEHLWIDRTGATAIEYVLMLALVALASLGAWSLLGDRVDEQVRCAASAVGGAASPCLAGAAAGGVDEAPLPGGADASGRPPSAVSQAIASLPESVRRALAEQGTRIVVSDGSVASALPASLRDDRPRGWPRGTTFADVPAVYLPAQNEIVLAPDKLGDRLTEALAHEVGHAIDLGRALSNTRAFRAAYDAALGDDAGDGYYTQPGRAGREESYAETFALYTTDPDALRRRAPALYDYWQAHASDPYGARARELLAKAGTGARPFDFGVGFVEDALDATRRYTPLGAALEHGPGLLGDAGRWAWTETPVGTALRATWNAAPSEVRSAGRAVAGFSVGVAEVTTSLVELAMKYSPTPAGMINAAQTVFGAAKDPAHTWAAARAMPSAIASYYAQLGRDLVSGDAYVAGHASGLLTFDVASLFVPVGAAGRGVTVARAAARTESEVLEHGAVAVPRAAELETQAGVRRGFCFAAGTPVLVGGAASVPIESLRVGARVRTLGGDDDATTEVEPATWRVVRVEMADPSGSGDVIEIALLRSTEWISELGASEGRTLHLELHEMGIEGRAYVRAIEPAPAIEPGAGHVVLATIASTSAQLLALRFDGSEEVLEATASHPLYSLDREAWVRAGELRAGERVRALSGAVTVTAIEPVAGAHRVYNLEVETEHAFLVSQLGVLSHNNNPCATPDDFAEWSRRALDQPDNVIRTVPEGSIPLDVPSLGPMRDWVRSSATWSSEVEARIRAGWQIQLSLESQTSINSAERVISIGTEDSGGKLARSLKIAEQADLEPLAGPETFATADEYAARWADYQLRQRARTLMFEAQINHELALRGATTVSDPTATSAGLHWLQVDDPVGELATALGKETSPAQPIMWRAALEEQGRTYWEEVHAADRGITPIDDPEGGVLEPPTEAEAAAARAAVTEQLTEEMWPGAEALRARTWEFTPSDLEHAVHQAIDRAGMADLRFDQTQRIVGTVVLDGRTGALRGVVGRVELRRSGRPAGPTFVVGHRMLREGVHSGISRGSYQLGVEDGAPVVRYWRGDGDHGFVRIERHD